MRSFFATETAGRGVECRTAAGDPSADHQNVKRLRRHALQGQFAFARAIQLGIEYDPQPPFDAGSPEKAGPHVTELAKAMLG